MTALMHETPTADLVRAMTRTTPLLILRQGMVADLENELGGAEAVARFLIALAGEIGHPVALNDGGAPTDPSRTVFIAPTTWSEQRTLRWVEQHRADLDAAFGPFVWLKPEVAS